MKKRVLCIALVIVMLYSLSMSAFAAQSDVSIVIDNKEVEFTASSGEPFVDKNGRTQVPLRVVMEQYGCDVEWDSANNSAVITKGDTTVIVPVGQSYILVNGKTVAMDTAALVQNGRTYLPIRAVLEAFGADVEWDNGKVSVSSPVSGEFENIYVDKDGNLIFELSNGNKINAGSVSNGKDGKDGRDGSDGVSVVDAYVDGSGNLMITLSSGRTINAGNVGVGGSMSGLTFSDYSVGTKFYLTQPTGAFDVTVYVNNVPYVVSFSNVYYELTGKHSYNDTGAWTYSDGITTYQPYDVTMKISGQTSASLAGKYITVTFGEVESGSWYYKGFVAADGTFQISQAQDEWRAPKSLMLSKVIIDDGSSTPGVPSGPSVDPTPWPDDDEIPAEILEMIAACAGDWAASANDVVTLKEDGTLIYNGVEYTPEYEFNGDQLTAGLWNEGMAFVFDIGDEKMLAEHSGKTYYKGQTPEMIVIAERLSKVAGTWSLPSDTTKTFTITADGTITYGGTNYTPTYNIDGNHLLANVVGCADIRTITFDCDEMIADVRGGAAGYYYKNGSWDVVTLTKDNFLTYYEYKEDFTINYNAFGEYEDTTLVYYYVLKDEYASSLIESGSTATAKIQLDVYSMEYVIDFENERYTVTEPGDFVSSHTYSRDCYSYDAATIMLGSTGTSASSTYKTANFYKIQFF